MGKKWEIIFQLEQRNEDRAYVDRVENYYKIISLIKELRDILVTKGIPCGFSIVDRESGIREGGESFSLEEVLESLEKKKRLEKEKNVWAE